jgi:replicative DNA helicase
MGKTAFALNLALQAARQDISLIFSLEMSKKQLLKRMAGFTGLIDSRKLKNPKSEFHDEDWHQFTDTIGRLSKLNLIPWHSLVQKMALVVHFSGRNHIGSNAAIHSTKRT